MDREQVQIMVGRLEREKARYDDYTRIQDIAEKIDTMEEANRQELQKVRNYVASLPPIVTTDTDTLKAIIDDSGLIKEYIAEALGIPLTDYMDRENGIQEFTASEIQEMRKLLNLSNSQIKKIFFS